jgi:hypothetical protein
VRYLVGFLCVCALSVAPMVGCSEAEGLPPECLTDADCDDQNECTADLCDLGGSCSWQSSELNGDPCNRDGATGVCVGGFCGECQSSEDCDDQNECTHEYCVLRDDAPSWCEGFVFLELPCELNGLVGICVPLIDTSQGECIENGLCGDVDCDDGNECTYDYCREAGVCSYANDDLRECCPWPQGGCFFSWDYGHCEDGRCVD